VKSVADKVVLITEAAMGMGKGVLPTPFRDFLGGKVFGVHKTMEEFKGRA